MWFKSFLGPVYFVMLKDFMLETSIQLAGEGLLAPLTPIPKSPKGRGGFKKHLAFMIGEFEINYTLIATFSSFYNLKFELKYYRGSYVNSIYQGI